MLRANDCRKETHRDGPGDKRYGYAICGFGPAGSGFLLHAWKTGLLERMAERGLVIVDRAGSLGAGSIGQYLLTGNSLATAFTDCIDDPGYRPLFDDLCERDPAVRAMRAVGADAPPLDLTAVFLEVMVERFVEHLQSEFGVTILRETDVSQIERAADGGYNLRVRHRSSGRETTLAADEVISAFGGRQRPDVVAQDPVAPGLKLEPWRERLMMSDHFLRLTNQEIRDAIPLSNRGDVVVIGGSHSTMSTVDRLAQALAPVGLKRLTILHRTPIRLYYASAEEARLDGYTFNDPEDICPMSGRVNRFGGMRYRSFTVGQSILKTGAMPELPVAVQLVRLPRERFDGADIRARLDGAPAILTCLGYQANLPCLNTRDGLPIQLDNTPTGLRVDDRAQALTTDGRSVDGFFVIGLGSKLLRRSETIGGELSFQGQADGVWLYQNHGAIPVVRAIEETIGLGARPEPLSAEPQRLAPQLHFAAGEAL